MRDKDHIPIKVKPEYTLSDRVPYVSIHPDIIQKLNLREEEMVEITNPKLKITIKTGYNRGNMDDKEIVRLPSAFRGKLGTEIDDKIILKNTGEFRARQIKFAYFEGQKLIKKSKELKQMLDDQLVSKGSIISIEKYNRKFYLKVIDFIPEVHEARIYGRTNFIFLPPNFDDPILIDKLRKVKDVSNKVRLEMLKNYLDLSLDLFIEKIVEWENALDFTIEGNYIYFLKGDTPELAEAIDRKFNEWQEIKKKSLEKKSKCSNGDVFNSKNEKTSIPKIDQNRRDNLIDTLAALGDKEAQSIINVPYGRDFVRAIMNRRPKVNKK